MELKKGYIQTEVGVIPEDWKIKLLVDLTNILTKQTGFDYSAHIKPALETNRTSQNIPFIQNKDFDGLKINYDTDYFIPKSVAIKFPKILLDERCLLISISGSIGNVAVFDNTQLAFIGGAVAIAKFKDKSILNWVMYYLLSSVGRKAIFNNVKSGSHQNLTLEDIRKLFIPIPNIQEQKAIANALSDSDAYITSLEKLIEKKRQIKQGTMQELLKPKDGWIEKLLTDIVDFTHGKAHEQFIVEDGAYCVVNSKFISTEGKVSKFSNQSFLTARKNDILTVLSDLPNGKALAKCFFVDRDHYYAVNQRICIWRSKNADPKFLFYLLNRHPYFLAINDGVSQTHILNHHIKKCCINIPMNKSEQENIGKILSSMDEELKVLEEKLKKAKSLKEGMMQQLLTGKIRII